MDEDYNYYMAQAAKYREMADNLDGYQRRQLIHVVQDLEAKARRAKEQAEKPAD